MKKKKIVLIFILLVVSNIFGQNKIEEILYSRKNIIPNNNKTIVNPIEKKIDLSYLCDKNYLETKIFSTYNYSVFHYTTAKSKQIYYLKQWSVPIVIFFDKRIPKETREKFKFFFDQLNNIKNLKIKYTNNLEKSNYYIKVSDNKFNGYSSSYKFKDVNQKNIHPLTNLTYNLLTDKNNKFYSGILKISNHELFDKKLALKKLKQVFFMSLGNFMITRYRNDYSLLSEKYTQNETISNHDVNFLKIHYGHIYNQKINGTTFKKLKKIANYECK